ncbi:hypothetical protein AALP_AA8G161800 [Arabis alpina]|uniref:F-box domain-containing protein n=1 Tax=Arabis alpina TaxID=50452 RepID=A0A087G7E3_ARAAL|nr:hypothetical protein AALP_AA8G161800 [Arabis alpina]
MVTPRSKKRKRKNVTGERNKFVQIPLKLVTEILGRLPVKSVARCLLVSKTWAKLISSKRFIKSFPFGSSTSQPRVLVAFIDIDRRKKQQDWYLFSPSSSSTSFMSCLTFPLLDPEREYNAHYVNGLISLGYGQEQQFITNPSAGKIIHLPSVKIRTSLDEQIVRSFFGYDSVHDQYKVLCLKEKPQISTKHQVHTLGAKKKPWRAIQKCRIQKCRIRHRTFSNRHVCIDGVVYYVAYTGADFSQLSLMRFHLKSVSVNLFTSLPPGIGPLHFVTLINYKGKVALSAKTSTYKYEVWIVDQDAVWSKKSFSIEPWKDLIQLSFHITGTIRTGEFVLAPRHYSEGFSVIYYNPDTNSFRNTKVEVNEDYEFKRRGTRAIVFSDYVESVRLL